jgi:hypothetical protein
MRHGREARNTGLVPRPENPKHLRRSKTKAAPVIKNSYKASGYHKSGRAE